MSTSDTKRPSAPGSGCPNLYFTEVGPVPTTATRTSESVAYPNADVDIVVNRLLCGSGGHCIDRRGNPRFTFVRPARLSFVRPRLAFGGNSPDNCPTDFETEFEVVTTDISRNGIGILCWDTFRNSFPRSVSLQIEGVVFGCEIRWREHIVCLIDRYGLQIHDVLDKPPNCE